MFRRSAARPARRGMIDAAKNTAIKQTERNPKQDKPLSKDDIKKMEEAGYDIHQEKGNKHTGGIDLYKDKKGNICIKPKSNKGEGEPLNININDL